MGQGLCRGLRAAALGAVLALTACVSNPPAPVEDRSSGDAAPAPERDRPSAVPAAEPGAAETYRVAKGDTLYAIAFKRGIDFKELASWNGIAPPYRIFVGQELRLRAPSGYVAPAAVAAVPERNSGNAAESVAAPAASGATSSGLSNPSGKPQPSMFEDVPPATATAQSNPPSSASSSPAQNAAPVVAGSKPASENVKPPPPATRPPPEASAKPPVAASNPSEPAPKPVEAAPAVVAPPPAAKNGDAHVAELNAGGVRWRWPGDGKV